MSLKTRQSIVRMAVVFIQNGESGRSIRDGYILFFNLKR